MDFYLGRNRAFAQLGQATLNGSDTNVALATGHGARLYPVTTASGFKVRAHIIERDPVTDAVIKCELINITNNVSDSLIIERAVEATRATDSTNTYAATPQTFTNNAYIEEVISVAVMKQITDDVNIRLPLAGGAMTGPILQKKSANLASATTTDLSTMTGDSGHITGTTTIVGLGTAQAGTIKEVTFDGILTITHNATSLILPGSANIITAAGDTFTFKSEWSGNWKCIAYAKASGTAVIATATITGEVRVWTMPTLPSGFLLCDGTAVSRATYASLFAILNPNLGTATMTIATPCVVTLTAHGLTLDNTIYFTTTGALPTGLTANTIYYVISAGLTANAFQLSATRWGAAINSSGTQSGTHTLYRCPYGLGNGSTTFNVPNLKGKVVVGLNTADTEFDALGETGGAKTHTLDITQIPPHTHTVPADAGTLAAASNQRNSVSGTSASGSAGGGAAHNNIQPYITMNYIIAT